MSFSERHGYTEARASLQFESMDEPLRNAWDIVHKVITDSDGKVIIPRIWGRFLKRPADKLGIL
jgi:hypothetical protein